MAQIRITAEKTGVSMTATLNDSETAKALLGILPTESRAQTWGDEVYFGVPLQASEEDPQAAVPSGAIAYWPPGNAFCIFFGQTPASPVNLLGAVDDDENEFAKVPSGETVKLEAV